MSKITEDFPASTLLIEAGYTTVAKINKASDEELLAIEHFGRAALKKVREAVEALSEPGAAPKAAGPRKCANPVCGFTVTADPCPYCGQAA